jgi:hypothetical protein
MGSLAFGCSGVRKWPVADATARQLRALPGPALRVLSTEYLKPGSNRERVARAAMARVLRNPDRELSIALGEQVLRPALHFILGPMPVANTPDF